MLGLRTVVYHVGDLRVATDWYRRLFGVAPYFEESFYVGFNIGGFELGLDPDPSEAVPGPGGVVSYWGVADVDGAVAHARSVGAAVKSPPRDVGGGIRVATLADPFGNVVGLIENPHFKLEV